MYESFLAHIFVVKSGSIYVKPRQKQESRAVAGKPCDAAVIFQHGGKLSSWIWSNRK